MRNILAVCLLAPGLAMAAGSDNTAAPATTPTSTTCADGTVWDSNSQSCVDAQSNLLDETDRLNAVRELAYAGRYGSALSVLDTVANQDHDMVHTYRGFTARKMGDMDAALKAYQTALSVNPDNLLARSYMGQGLLEQGKRTEAFTQLIEIRARGGSGTWAEASLDRAIRTGVLSNY